MSERRTLRAEDRVSRNLLDPGEGVALKVRLRFGPEHPDDILDLWSVRSLLPLFKWKHAALQAHLQDLAPDYTEGRTRFWRIERVIDHLWAKERAKLRRLGSGDELDPAQERARRDRAAADAGELQVAKLRGDLVEVDRVVEHLGRPLAAHRTRLEQLPGMLAPELADRGPREVEAALADALNDAGRSLSDSIRAARRSM